MAKPEDFCEEEYDDPKLAYFALAMMLDLSERDQTTVASKLPADFGWAFEGG